MRSVMRRHWRVRAPSTKNIEVVRCREIKRYEMCKCTCAPLPLFTKTLQSGEEPPLSINYTILEIVYSLHIYCYPLLFSGQVSMKPHI